MIDIVMGGQYGSEGKGSVVSWLAAQKKYDLVIRTGSPNAGHTFKGRTARFLRCGSCPVLGWRSQRLRFTYLRGLLLTKRFLRKS